MQAEMTMIHHYLSKRAADYQALRSVVMLARRLTESPASAASGYSYGAGARHQDERPLDAAMASR